MAGRKTTQKVRLMRYVVAVSGGVDSVVLLDMLVNGRLPNSTSQIPLANCIVVHFDHGIRPESARDAAFVRDLAAKYGLAFETRREELGANASEELARDRRYAFLRSIAKRYDAKIMTAHHADDVIETIAINLTRGTGWRGLAVLGSADIERPLLGVSKVELLAYAKERELTWHEDPTNDDTKYLRNAVRQKLAVLDNEAKQLLALYWKRQRCLAQAIDAESQMFVQQAPYSRYMLIAVGDSAALELLRAIFVNETGVAPMRPQLARALLAVKTYAPTKSLEVSRGVTLRFTQTTFVVEAAPPVLS